MEEIMEKRIWQRVRGESDRTEQVRQLLADQGRLRYAYRNFARRGGAWRRLLEGKEAQIAALRGLLRILTGQGAALPRPVSGPGELTACFSLERKLLAELTELSREGELGPIFALLAERQKGQCRILLELLGTM